MENVFSVPYLKLLKTFIHYEVEFLLIGGHAAIFYGVRRTTSDIDILVNPTRENGIKILKAFHDLELVIEDLIPEDFENEIYLTFGGLEDAVDLLTYTPAIDFETAFSNSKVISIGEVSIKVISVYDLIKNKQSLNRPGNKALIDLYDVSELKRIFNIP